MANVGRRYVNPYRVMLGECTRKEIREALQSGELKAAIIPIGATEQHNEHLSLDLDIVLSTFISQQAALQLYPPSHCRSTLSGGLLSVPHGTEGHADIAQGDVASIYLRCRTEPENPRYPHDSGR